MFCLWSLAGGKSLFVCGKVVLCLTYFYVRTLVRPVAVVLRPSVRPVVRPVVVVRPLSFRPVVAVVVLCPSVRPVVDPLVIVRPLSVRPRPCRRCRRIAQGPWRSWALALPRLFLFEASVAEGPSTLSPGLIQRFDCRLWR